MATALRLLQERGDRCGDPPQLWPMTIQFYQQFQTLSTHDCPRILLAAPEPVTTIAAFTAAIAAGCTVALANPQWAAAEWQQVIALVDPDWTIGPRAQPRSARGMGDRPHLPAGTILIPTGGSSGQLRFAQHRWSTLAAAVAGFQAHFHVNSIASFCLLPLYHVSGLMQWIRSLISGGSMHLHGFKQLRPGPWPTPSASCFLSLVPTQLQALLDAGAATWLAQFRTVLLGGAPPWPTLLEQARQHRLPLALSYGMTETAALVAALHPEEFWAGLSSCGRSLPHADIAIVDETGHTLAPNQIGRLCLRATSLCVGYYPANGWAGDRLLTDDLGYWDDHGHLHLVGRHSRSLISGGENIFPEEIEAAIQASGLVQDVYVIGQPDAHWGEIVVAVYVPRPGVQPHDLQAALGERLSRYKHPKRWLEIDRLPRNAQGKINAALLRTWLQS